MTCPKCGYDAGGFKFCPECGNKLIEINVSANETQQQSYENGLSSAKATKLKITLGNHRKVVIITAVSVICIILTIFICLNRSKQETDHGFDAKAKYIEWSIIENTYVDNAISAQENYNDVKLLFYVEIGSLETGSFPHASVTIYDSNWNRLFAHSIVYFKDYSQLHTGGFYEIEGYIDHVGLTLSKDEIYGVTIKDAEVVTQKYVQSPDTY